MTRFGVEEVKMEDLKSWDRFKMSIQSHKEGREKNSRSGLVQKYEQRGRIKFVT